MTCEPFYPITSLRKDDLRELFRDARKGEPPARVCRRIDALSEADIRYMAGKLAEVFCNCCYWDALLAIFEAYSPMAEAAPREVVPAEAPRSGFDEGKKVRT
jgi:hypothetical protein